MLNTNIVETHAIVQEKNVQEENKKVNKRLYLQVKRLFDIVISFLAMIILSPLILFIGILIKIDSDGPIFYKHKRIGKNGKYIYLYKFRTMVKNADQLHEHFDQEQLEKFKENYKLKNDPRITGLGKFLRKTSLDELPQLLNVFKGELSLVGPRPIVDGEIDKYGGNKNKFLSATPGLTGYWQVNGRSYTTYKQRIDMELYYIDNMNIWLDVKIILKTFITVIKKEGAV